MDLTPRSTPSHPHPDLQPVTHTQSPTPSHPHPVTHTQIYTESPTPTHPLSNSVPVLRGDWGVLKEVARFLIPRSLALDEVFRSGPVVGTAVPMPARGGSHLAGGNNSNSTYGGYPYPGGGGRPQGPPSGHRHRRRWNSSAGTTPRCDDDLY